MLHIFNGCNMIQNIAINVLYKNMKYFLSHDSDTTVFSWNCAWVKLQVIKLGRHYIVINCHL